MYKKFFKGIIRVSLVLIVMGLCGCSKENKETIRSTCKAKEMLSAECFAKLMQSAT